MSTGPTDDELLDAIGRALTPSPAAPSAAEMAALRMAISVRRTARAPTRRFRTWRRPVPVLLAATLGLGGVAAGTAAAAAAGASLPAPLRSAVAAVGIHVGEDELKAAKVDMRHVEAALASADRPAVAGAAAQLRRCLATLDPDDRGRVEPVADDLLHRADELLASPAPEGASNSPGAASALGRSAFTVPENDPRPAPRASTTTPTTVERDDGEPSEAAPTTVASGGDSPSIEGRGGDGHTTTAATSDGDGHDGATTTVVTATDGGSATGGGSSADGGSSGDGSGSGGTDGGGGTSDGGTSGH